MREYYPLCVIDPGSVSDSVARRKAESKRLTRAKLAPLLQGLPGRGGPLLKRIVERGAAKPTVLEEKLLAGGAPPAIVDAAKSLRANASSQRLRLLSSGSGGEELESLHEVLRIRVISAAAAHADERAPAGKIWASLLDGLSTHAAVIDPNRLFGEMPELLLGEVCELADLCVVDFGAASV